MGVNMEKVYNKLVRDKIPEIIQNNNEVPVIRSLSDEEFKMELYKKLLEECNEVLQSKNEDEVMEELADVLEIVMSISNLQGRSLEDIINIADRKRDKRGGFEKKIFLEKTIL